MPKGLTTLSFGVTRFKGRSTNTVHVYQARSEDASFVSRSHKFSSAFFPVVNLSLMTLTIYSFEDAPVSALALATALESLPCRCGENTIR